MPTYSYRAYGARGTVETGSLDSPSEAAAYQTLKALGLTVVELREGAAVAGLPWWRRDISLGDGRLPLADQAALAEQMATMLRVRLPVLEMLRILAQGTARAETREKLERTARLVAEGMPLAQAFAQAGPKVAPVFLSLLRAGALSDALPKGVSLFSSGNRLFWLIAAVALSIVACRCEGSCRTTGVKPPSRVMP